MGKPNNNSVNQSNKKDNKVDRQYNYDDELDGNNVEEGKEIKASSSVDASTVLKNQKKATKDLQDPSKANGAVAGKISDRNNSTSLQAESRKRSSSPSVRRKSPLSTSSRRESISDFGTLPRQVKEKEANSR
jgi:hypothetical protein